LPATVEWEPRPLCACGGGARPVESAPSQPWPSKQEQGCPEFSTILPAFCCCESCEQRRSYKTGVIATFPADGVVIFAGALGSSLTAFVVRARFDRRRPFAAHVESSGAGELARSFSFWF